MKRQKANRVELNGIVFDSQLEASVYREILAFCDAVDIRVHHPIKILPASDGFPETYWKCDFVVPRLSLYIEAKGINAGDKEWRFRLRTIAATRPSVFQNLIVVTSKEEFLCKGRKTITIGQLGGVLRERIRQV